MIASDPSNALQHYPMAMGRFGLNPFGENLYRLVLASSRKFLVAGKWSGAGTPRAKYCTLYPDVTALLEKRRNTFYVLEKWRNTFEITGGMTRQQWDSGIESALGPYPSRGEYQMVGDCYFDPVEVSVEKLITLVEAANKYSFAEKLVACRNQATKEEIERKCLRESIIRDCLPQFGPVMSSAKVSKGSKTQRILRSANELGLPVPTGIPGQVTGGAMIRKRKVA